MLLPLTASGQEWDKSDTQTITISNKLSARYQRRRRAVDRRSLAPQAPNTTESNMRLYR